LRIAPWTLAAPASRLGSVAFEISCKLALDALVQHDTPPPAGALGPNRFNALLGAGQAAERLGQRALARDYYRTLLAKTASR
jgi:hypothetical protein